MRWILAALLFFAAAPARAGDLAGVPLPRGSRADGDVQISGKGYRDTVEHMRKWLSKQGTAHRQIGPYRARGVDVTRFVSEDPKSPWLAIHVVRQAGRTWISVVSRPP